jgi:hypothetical protein
MMCLMCTWSPPVLHLARWGRSNALHVSVAVQAVNCTAPRPQAEQLFGRADEERQALEAVRSERYVEIRGGPGEGKTTLALRVVEVLAAEWTQEGDGGEVHVVDCAG